MSMVADDQARAFRVFIAASRSDADEIQKTLHEHGLVPVTIDTDAVPGTTWVDSLHRCIQNADMVLGVMGDRKEDRNVFFELGVASALNKPAVLLIPPDYPYEAVPPSGVRFLRTDLRDQKAVMFGLEQIRSISPREEAVVPEQGYRTQPIGPLADQLIDRLQQIGAGRELELEQIIYEAIRASGVSTVARDVPTVVRGREAEHSRVDLAVWSTDLEPLIANPLLIECKHRLGNQSVANEAFERMARALKGIQNGCGLVVYGEASLEVSLLTRRPPPVIFFISAAKFLGGLRNVGFASFVWGLRDRLACGMLTDG
jgi:hypothetical protein